MAITVKGSDLPIVAVDEEVMQSLKVQTLDLSNNKLTTLYPLGPVQGACKQLRSLNFANNRILKMAELDSMKGMSSVQELILEGNPVCTAYNDKSQYIRYFTIFDSKSRGGLIDAYHDDVDDMLVKTKHLVVGIVFWQPLAQRGPSPKGESLPFQKPSHPASTSLEIPGRHDAREFMRDSRNIMKVTNTESRREKLKTGRVNVVSFLSQLPETRHDPSSFTVDIPLVTPSLMCFTVFGILRVVNNGLIVPQVKSFTRTFFVVPQGAGFSIINETLFVTGGTDDQIKAYPTPENTLPAPTPTPSPVPTPVLTPAAPLATNERESILVQLCAETRMNRAFAERLEEQYPQRHFRAERIILNHGYHS
ncbi:hypothetical protein HPB51_014933 [Rhipicephalus microplus]|uniref:NTF2 domain-containing protein n=1 Tax=Rhipicephalus microplus TaxID=6941 RepID=A0A9J6E2B0_RHIMP|nr:hypothetical protein HPB51_014933 [Rhipicephalus microplus]